MKTILIIEDDPRIASALSLRFRDQGYETAIANDAIMGFDQAVRRRPDLVLLDIQLPGGNGLELAQRLRSQSETRHIPFILVTASKDPDLWRKAMEIGAAGLLEKPYDPGELIQLARYAMGDTHTAKIQPDLSPEELKPAPVRRGKKILIVEDDPKIAQALSIRLKSAGYETAVAQDALAGVGAAVKLEPDLVLLDISMPAGNGFTVAEKVQTLIARPTPFIFLTASKQAGLREKAKALGAAGFFEKPFDSEQLLTSIQQALHGPPAVLERG